MVSLLVIVDGLHSMVFSDSQVVVSTQNPLTVEKAVSPSLQDDYRLEGYLVREA